MLTYKLLKPPLKVNVSRIFKFQRGLLLPLLHKPDSDGYGYSNSEPSGSLLGKWLCEDASLVFFRQMKTN